MAHPWFLAEAVHHHGFGTADVIEDGEEFEGSRPGIQGHVRHAGGDQGHFPRTEEFLFLPHPLFGLAFQDVNDLFPAGMIVEEVGFVRRKSGAAEIQILTAGIFHGDEFRHRAPREGDVFGVVSGQVFFGRGWGAHAEGAREPCRRALVQMTRWK